MDVRINEKIFPAFNSLLGCGCMLMDGDGNVLKNEGACGCCCPASEHSSCITAHLHAAYQAERFGGKYIYFCPNGLVFCVAVCEPKSCGLYLVAGPIKATENDDFVFSDLSEPFSANRIAPAKFEEYAKTVSFFPPAKITELSDVLHAVAKSVVEIPVREEESETEAPEKEADEYVQQLKTRQIFGTTVFNLYPYEKEKLLIHAIRNGNEADARKYLNDLLGHIFFSEYNDLESIKIRAMELTVLISRAAIDGGADNSIIHDLNSVFISDFLKIDTRDDVLYALTKILREFSEKTFNLSHLKHSDVMTKAINFIRANYMRRITLEDVAEHTYLSPSYFSKIFSEEMKMNFSSYLNQIRIEKSKVLLSSKELSIIEIADMVGFYDQSYFNKVFKKITGVTPKKYRDSSMMMLK